MKVFSLLICLLLLNGCATTPQSNELDAGLPGSLSLAVELSDTPFFPQTTHQCGPAALATVLGFHGVTITPEALSSQIYLPGRKGSLQIEMIAAARRHEMLPYQIDGKLLDLFIELAAGNPVLVLQNLSFDWYPKWHYAVVVGYDADRQEIILRSGTTRRWVTPFEVFERTWQRADFWALVMVPIGVVPKTAKPFPYLKTAHAFVETGRPELALKAYRSASQHWPEVAEIWMILGNISYQDHDWPKAIEAFGTATSLKPESLDAWNNLAYALHANGCYPQAQTALQCGSKISPTDKNLQNSQRELNIKASNAPSTQCPPVQCD